MLTLIFGVSYLDKLHYLLDIRDNYTIVTLYRLSRIFFKKICKISQKETGLELDDSDLTRHPKDIVEACIIDNKLEK